MQVFDHKSKEYREKWEVLGSGRWNGAYYYSREIVENIIPRVKTDRNWVTVNVEGCAFDHSLVFIHNNLHPEHYDWLQDYTDLVLVCGVPETCDKVAHLGKAIYLPLSVDVGYVKQFKLKERDLDKAFFGRRSKALACDFEPDVDIWYGMERRNMLQKMAHYKQVYAVGRCAIEAKILGAKVLPYDPRYPKPGLWKVLDNKTAAKKLQAMLDEIDGEQ